MRVPLVANAMAVVCALASSSSALPAAAADAALPLSRVRLYETGVGYFERTGRLQGRGVLPVPAGHLDDALKTLVVLGRGKETAESIGFDSRVSRSMGRALAGVRGGAEDRLVYTEVLRSLKGASVRLRSGPKAYQGRLIDVLTGEESEDRACVAVAQEAATAASTAQPCEVKHFSNVLLYTSESAIVRIRVDDIDSVAPRDPALADRFHAALDAISPHGSQTQGSLAVVVPGGGDYTLGYVAEAPVWRSTYRLMLGEGEHGTLQGWALIHNDTDEDWKNVQIELVNGEPDSFMFPLAAPRYAHRELVTPPRDLSTVPQLLDTTVDNLWLDGEGDTEGIGLGAIGTIGQGFGSGHGRLGGSHVTRAPALVSPILDMGNLAATASANSVEAEALFLYKLPSKTALGARSSALVPFVTQSVKVQRIAWFDHARPEGRSALRLDNDTAQTLPAGTLAVFFAGGFAGETLLERLKPGEVRVLEYGVDLDVAVEVESKTDRELPKVVSFDGAKLTEHFVRERDVTYTVTNKSGAGRSVHVALDAVNNAKVEGADRVGFEEGRQTPYVVFSLSGKQELVRPVHIAEGLVRRHPEPTRALLTRLSASAAIAGKSQTVPT